MLIRQNQLLGEATAFLDTLYRVSPDENVYPAQMVNIHHQSRLGRDLIQLESFLQFGKMNGITDAGYAIHLICEANGVPSANHVAFAVNEENLLLDISLLETYCQLKNANFGVYVKPISDYSVFRTRLNEALMFDDAYPDYESSIYLQKYVRESVLDDAADKVNKGVGQAKDAVAGGAKEVAGKLASIRKEIANKAAKASATTGTAKVKLMQQINKLKDASSELTGKLSSAKNSIAHKAEGASNAVKSAVHNAQRAVRAKAREAHSGMSNAIDNASNAVSKHVDSAKDAVSNAADNIKSKFSS